MLIYRSIRYTDFLVNEILPSGVVVHLDNLKLPQLDKLVEKSSNAKITPFATIGTTSAHHPSISEPTSFACKNDDSVQTDASSPHPPEKRELPHDKVEVGISNNGSHEQDCADESQLTKQGRRTLELQPASGPRQKEKIFLRQTSSELVLVGDNEDACIQQQIPRQVSETMGNGHSEDERSPHTSAQVETELVGDVKNTEDDTQEQSQALAQPSSAADWQTYADVNEGFQVCLQLYLMVKSESYSSFQQKTKSSLHLTLVSKLLIQF